MIHERERLPKKNYKMLRVCPYSSLALPYMDEQKGTNGKIFKTHYRRVYETQPEVSLIFFQYFDLSKMILKWATYVIHKTRKIKRQDFPNTN